MKTIKSHGWSNVNIEEFIEADFDTGKDSRCIEFRSAGSRIQIHGIKNIISLKKYLEKIEQEHNEYEEENEGSEDF